jgi:hypothetical protein
LNLEIALGARARNSTMPIVLRIAEASFAESIARHFEFETTYSAAALAAPAFVGLSRFPGSRGRVTFGGQEFAIGEVGIVENFRPAPPQDAILIAVSHQGDFVWRTQMVRRPRRVASTSRGKRDPCSRWASAGHGVTSFPTPLNPVSDAGSSILRLVVIRYMTGPLHLQRVCSELVFRL